jgi:hypothetical protein
MLFTAFFANSFCYFMLFLGVFVVFRPGLFVPCVPAVHFLDLPQFTSIRPVWRWISLDSAGPEADRWDRLPAGHFFCPLRPFRPLSAHFNGWIRLDSAGFGLFRPKPRAQSPEPLLLLCQRSAVGRPPSAALTPAPQDGCIIYYHLNARQIIFSIPFHGS